MGKEVMSVDETDRISPGQLLWQLQAIATADTTALVQVVGGQLEVGDTAALSPELRAAVCSVEKSAGSIKVKFYDKLKALELLGKYLGLFDRTTPAEGGESPLLQAVLDATKEVMDTYDLPEVQQAAAAGDDMVEQTRFEIP